MTITVRRTGVVAGSSLAMLLTAIPLSANATQAGPASLDEIVVTATRRAERSGDVSSTITVVDQQAIASNALITDALANQPGVFLQQTTPGQGAAVVRGLKGSAILHLVDGMRLNNAIFRSAPTQYLALVPGVAVDRLEILRGTPASLYGSDAIGGVVQVVTHTPDFTGSDTQMRGTNTLAYDSADLNQLIRSSVDAGNAQGGVSLSAEWQSTGGRRIGGGERLATGAYEAFGGRALFMLTPSTSRTLKLDLQAMEQPETPRVDELIAGFGQTEPSSSEYAFAPNRRYFAHASIENTQGVLGLAWRMDLGWQRIDDDRITRNLDADARRRETNRSDLLGITATVSGNNDRFDWIAGAEIYSDEVSSSRSEESISTGDISEVAARFPDGASVLQTAMFGNVSMTLAQRHTLTGGLRLTRASIDLPGVAGNPESEFSISDLSGDAGWLWQVNPRWSAAANVGAGFRAPNIFDLGTLGNRPGNRFNVPNTRLDAEHVLQGDVGLRYRGDSVDYSLSAFALSYDDRIVSVATGAVTADGREVVQSTNAARAEISGIEANADWRITDSLGATFMLSAIRGDQRVDGNQREPSDRIPPLTGRIVLDWLTGSGSELSAWLNFASAQDRLSNGDISDSRIDPQGTPGWVVLGTSWQRWLTDHWRLRVAADNLLDKRYRMHGSGLDARGRSLSLSVTHDWR